MSKLIPPRVLGMMEKAQHHKEEVARTSNTMEQYRPGVRETNSWVHFDATLPNGEQFTFTVIAGQIHSMLATYKATHTVELERLQRQIGDALIEEEVA